MDVVNNPAALGSLLFVTGPLAGRTMQINKPITTIGRDETSNDIVVSDNGVSRHHAQIALKGNQFFLEKLAPQNTVTVNSREVQQAPLADRDTIKLGTGTTFIFQAGMGAGAYPPPQYPQQQQPSQGMPSPQYPQQQPSQGMSSPQWSGQRSPYPAPISQPPQPQPQSPNNQFYNNSAPVDGTQRVTFAPLSQPGGGAGAGVPSIEVSSNVHSEKQTFSLNKPVINIGREASNDIVINELVVSGYHAQIVQEGNQYILIHPHPSRGKTLNGLLYQGNHITGTEQFRKPLMRGDVFRIGDEHGTLVTLDFNDGSGAAQEALPEIRPIPLGAPLITLGRLPDNTVVLNHPQVSSHHARLELVRNKYRIVDQSSTNHVYVNGQRVSTRELNPGDEIHIGPFNLTFTGRELTQLDESNGIRIEARQLKKTGSNKTILINDISIAIPPRKFVALVGGSGAGKSTLMDALNGLRPAQQGTVYYNGKDYYSHLAAFSTQLGYVPQDDIIHRDLSVERALYYAAKLRLASDMTQDQIKARIDSVLEDVEMKHRRHLLVSKLSGGQRKRVSIALELLANPSVFFLDEPTSGLDPGLDRRMMTLLRNLADKGHTIVLVTHATNNINSCDYICFLAQGGRLAYFGPPNEAKAYFDKTDFAEIYSALEPTDENPNIPAEAETRFQSSPQFQKYVVSPLSRGPASGQAGSHVVDDVVQPKRGNPWKQFRLLSGRYLELLKNDTGNLLILLLQAPIIAVILLFMAAPDVFAGPNVVTCSPVTYKSAGIPRAPGFSPTDCGNVQSFLSQPGNPLAQQIINTHGGSINQAIQSFIQPASGGDAQKILFIMAFAAIMFGCINGAREIVKEVPIYRRERTVNLGIAPYLFSKMAVLGFLCLIQSAILVFVVNVKAPFHQGIFLPIIVEIYITMFLTALSGLMLGLTVSALAPNNDRATSFIPILLIPQVIFSGIIFQFTSPPLQIIGSFFSVRWAMAAMGSSIGLHGQFVLPDGSKSGEDFSFQGTLFSTHSRTDAILHLLLCWGVLLLMVVILSFLTAYFLKRKDVRR